jgi:hypothetical protein
MASFLDTEQFKVLTLLPKSWVEAVETVTPGFTQARIDYHSDWIEARLRKRYGRWSPPYPGIVIGWTTRLVTLDVDIKRGVQPTDEQFKLIEKQAIDAAAEVKEAADSDVGLFDLPVTDEAAGSGVTQGSPRVYSETSPYVWLDGQALTGRQQDQGGRGSGT